MATRESAATRAGARANAETNAGARSGARTKGRKKKREYYFDNSLLLILFFLVAFGLIMIYSASSYVAFQDYDGDSAHYFKRQLIAALIGFAGMFIMSVIRYHFWEKFYIVGYVASLLLLLPVLHPTLGIESHGARRWYKIPIIGFQVQPAEIVKVAIILFMAVMICKIGRRSIQTFRGFLFLMALVIPAVIAIKVITNNLSSALIVLMIAFVMVFVASPDYKKFLIMFAVGAVAVAILVMVVSAMESADTAAQASGEGFRFGRIRAWLNLEGHSDGLGYQVTQAMYAIGSGGIWGKGLGSSMQKLSFLPEAQNDMIFSIICEELGLFGGAAIIFMFIILIWRLMIIAINAPDLFGSMLVVGVIAHIAVQAVLNVAVVTNIIPNTGISLPFISYGGSSILFLLLEMGLVFSVSREIPMTDI